MSKNEELRTRVRQRFPMVAGDTMDEIIDMTAEALTHQQAGERVVRVVDIKELYATWHGHCSLEDVATFNIKTMIKTKAFTLPHSEPPWIAELEALVNSNRHLTCPSWGYDLTRLINKHKGDSDE